MSRKAALALNACAIRWCVALAIESSRTGHCAAHEVNEKLHPMPLAANEELIDGSFGACPECEVQFFDRATGATRTESDGRCSECRGTGECDDVCSHGHRCEHDCEACRGTGECQTCGGSGYGGVRVKEKAA